jgi:hypothetical protein
MVRAHLKEAAVVLAILADEHRLNRRLHVVVDSAPAGASEEREGAVVGVRRPFARRDLGEAGAAIKYQITASRLPLAKDLDDFVFKGTPINEALVRDLAGGGFIAQQRNAVFIGGTEPES